jgi:FMN reductase
MTTRTLAVISAGLSQPSSTRMLADKLAVATVARLAEAGIDTEVATFELRDYAQDIMNNMLTGFPSPRLDAVIEAVTGADGLIADNRSLTDMPVVIGATAGTARHSLALEYVMRPMFTYLHAVVAPTSVFAASEDWGSGADKIKALPDRIDRAAGELSALMAASDRSSQVRDPFALDESFSPTGGFQPEY